MIYTLTFNPSVDYYLHIPTLKTGEIHKIQEYEFIAGGKGINVSRMLGKLGIPSTCVFFSGGFTGAFLKDELDKEELITVHSIETGVPSRINVKIRHDGETDLNTSGQAPTEANVEDLLRYFECLEEGDFLCVCGSLQNKEMSKAVKKLSKLAHKKGAKVFLDVPNMSAEDIISCHPTMIKPNLEELQEMMGTTEKFPEILKSARENVLAKGVDSILLSMGGDGGCYLSQNECYRIHSPKLKPLNTVAAGDSMLTGTVAQMFLGKDIKECIAYGAANGSAAVLVPYIPEKGLVEDILKDVTVTEMSL